LKFYFILMLPDFFPAGVKQRLDTVEQLEVDHGELL